MVTRQSAFRKALESIHSVEETINALRATEQLYSDENLSIVYFLAADKLSTLNAFDHVLCYGEKGLTTFTANNRNRNSCLLVADVLRLLSNASFHLKNYTNCLDYLNRANKVLCELLDGKEDYNSIVFEKLRVVETDLYTVKDAMGDREGAVVHALKNLEIKEKTMKEGCTELGDANMSVCDAYLRAFDHREALPFCLKGLEIYEKLGVGSMEVADARRILAVIYHEMRECKKSLEVNRLAVSVLKKLRPGSTELLIAEIEGAGTMIELAQYEEAVDAMKDVVTLDGIERGLRVKSFLTIAKALCCLWRFRDAERFISVARRMLEGKEIEDPLLVSVGFSDLSWTYQKREDLDTAISMMKSAVACPAGLPRKLILQKWEELKALISKSGKWNEEVPYFESEVEKLKQSFGPQHCLVGYGYSNLGVAYFESGQNESSANSVMNAKSILDVTLGPYHLSSLKTSHSLSMVYETIGRYREAMEIEEKVIEGLKEKAPSEQKFLKEAAEHLRDMEILVTKSPTRASSRS